VRVLSAISSDYQSVDAHIVNIVWAFLDFYRWVAKLTRGPTGIDIQTLKSECLMTYKHFGTFSFPKTSISSNDFILINHWWGPTQSAVTVMYCLYLKSCIAVNNTGRVEMLYGHLD
jgi:hypothetical protein